jgi:hypothetical protein
MLYHVLNSRENVGIRWSVFSTGFCGILRILFVIGFCSVIQVSVPEIVGCVFIFLVGYLRKV